MIPFQEIQEISEAKRVNIETIEKDYCLTWLLCGLAHSTLKRKLTFYGGTAIHKAYSPDHRYSEDLDFTSESYVDISGIFEALDGLFHWVAKESNIIMTVRKESLSIRGDRHLFQISFDGFPELSHEKLLRVDVSAKNVFPSPPIEAPLIFDYSDLKGTTAFLRCYPLKAIVVEKIATLFEGIRKEPRDIYDLWFLLRHKKLRRAEMEGPYKHKYGIDLKIALASLPAKLKHPIFAQLWENRLRHQVPDLPPFSTVLKEINRNLV